jgi:hypothetical protein
MAEYGAYGERLGEPLGTVIAPALIAKAFPRCGGVLVMATLFAEHGRSVSLYSGARNDPPVQ